MSNDIDFKCIKTIHAHKEKISCATELHNNHSFATGSYDNTIKIWNMQSNLNNDKTIKEEGNVLLLDEPTNDIDVNTLRAIEEGLENFAGCAVIISHDRWFLDRICTHILAFEGDSNVFFFEGSYSDYEENKLKRLGKTEPTRVRYRKLTND